MKKLKFTRLNLMQLFIAISSMVVLVSCGSDDTVVVVDDPIDFAALNSKITEAEALIASTEEGTAAGQYTRGSQAVLQGVIDAAKVVADDETSTQTAVDNTVIALQAGIDVYNSGIIEAIDPTNLVGHWPFSAGSGTTALDYSGNGFDGTFRTGHVDMGAGTASWGTDRYGNANSALVVDLGAWVEVPYNAALNPTAMTVSIWVNVTEINDNNRFLGLRSWLGYKFQLQGANKAFFTAAVTPAHTGPIYDRDTDPPLNVNEWYHLAVTFVDGEMTFYIDGTLTQTWTDTPGTMAPVTDHSLAIGVGSSRYADTDVNYGDETHADYHVIPAAWGGYFRGSLDELRIYKTALSATQIQSIYDVEKP